MTMTTNESNIVAAGELANIVAEGQINQGLAKTLLDTFAPLAQQADNLARDSKAITVTDATQVSEMKEARKARLALREIRTTAEKHRREHKADFLKAGRIIDSIGKHVESLCSPEEERLLACEEFAERAEAAAKAKLSQDRAAELAPFGVDLQGYSLGDMKPAAYAALLEGAKAQKERREQEAAEARAAEEKRLADEAAERKRIAEENARLRAEKEAAEAAAAKTRRKAEAERAEAERKAKAERDALEAKARREREEAAAKLADERRERERLEREAADRAKKEAEAKAEAERKAKAAAAAPDADKLRQWAERIMNIEAPVMVTPEGRTIGRRVANIIHDTVSAIRETADALDGGER